MLDWLNLFKRFLPDFIKGAGVTIELTVVGLVIGFVLGWVLALARTYGPKGLKVIAIGYIELFRGTPLLVQLLSFIMVCPRWELPFLRQFRRTLRWDSTALLTRRSTSADRFRRSALLK